MATIFLSGTLEALTAAGTVALALIACIALVFTIVQLRTQRELARIDNLEKQLKYFESADFVAHRRALAKQRVGQGRLKVLKDDDAPSEMYRVLDVFEHLGFLVRKGHLRDYDVWHSFGAWAIPIYYDCRRVIEYEQADDKTFYNDFLWLVSKLEKIERKEVGKFGIPSDDDLYAYHCDEIGGGIPRRRKKHVADGLVKATVVSAEDKISVVPKTGTDAHDSQ
ncbi:MAG: hypothetical protein WCB53_18530 [Terriglobales bacterium]